MTISIQLQATDDLKMLEPLLQMLRQFEVNVEIKPGPTRARRKKPVRSDRSTTDLIERLHGVVRLPEGFDYKSAIATKILDKYGVHG